MTFLRLWPPFEFATACSLILPPAFPPQRVLTNREVLRIELYFLYSRELIQPCGDPRDVSPNNKCSRQQRQMGPLMNRDAGENNDCYSFKQEKRSVRSRLDGYPHSSGNRNDVNLSCSIKESHAEILRGISYAELLSAVFPDNPRDSSRPTDRSVSNCDHLEIERKRDLSPTMIRLVNPSDCEPLWQYGWIRTRNRRSGRCAPAYNSDCRNPGFPQASRDCGL